MDENKMKELLAGVVSGLSGELKEKAAACKDSGELIALLSELGVALPDELLDDAAGGFIPQKSFTEVPIAKPEVPKRGSRRDYSDNDSSDGGLISL